MMGGVVSNFIVQALCGEDITIFGDGSQTRSFCYVDDLVRGLIAMMESPREVVGPINVGNPSEFTIRQLAELVIELVGGPSRIVQRPLPQDDPKQRQPDITQARARRWDGGRPSLCARGWCVPSLISMRCWGPEPRPHTGRDGAKWLFHVSFAVSLRFALHGREGANPSVGLGMPGIERHPCGRCAAGPDGSVVWGRGDVQQLVLEWALPFGFWFFGLFFLYLRRIGIEAGHWGAHSCCWAPATAWTIIRVEHPSFVKPMVEDGFLLVGSYVMASGVARHFLALRHSHLRIAIVAVGLITAGISVGVFHSVRLETSLVQAACALQLVTALAASYGRWRHAGDRVLYGAFSIVASALLIQSAIFLAFSMEGRVANEWQESIWGFIFR